LATTETQVVRAQAKWVRTSARKARLVTEHIRGRSVPEARTVLAFTQRAAAHEVAKVLASAVANAEANHNLVGDELIVSEAVVDEGPTLKRWKPRARGRVGRIRKRTCHITIKLVPLQDVQVAVRPARVTGSAAPVKPAPEPEPEVEEPSVAEEPVAEEPQEEPKPKRTRKAKAETAEEAPAEEKPKRTRRKKTEGSED
jgi:ribosomal protein L22